MRIKDYCQQDIDSSLFENMYVLSQLDQKPDESDATPEPSDTSEFQDSNATPDEGLKLATDVRDSVFYHHPQNFALFA